MMSPASVSAAPVTGQRLIGAHMPSDGGVAGCITRGAAIGCTAVQVFTGSPRQWEHKDLTAETRDAFLAAVAATAMPFTVAHDSYLINLGAPSPEILDRSRSAFRRELDRANALQIPWVVTHMGAYLDGSEQEAVGRLISSLRLVLDETDHLGYVTGVALETTAGQGTGLGWRFEQLAEVLDGVGPHPRLGVCLDTCHVFAAGYDIRTPDAYAETWRLFDSTVGGDRLKVIHANDSLKPFSSRVDRHAHIGDGEIGETAFRLLVNDPARAHVPIVVETPDADTMHEENVRRLRAMITPK